MNKTDQTPDKLLLKIQLYWLHIFFETILKLYLHLVVIHLFQNLPL